MALASDRHVMLRGVNCNRRKERYMYVCVCVCGYRRGRNAAETRVGDTCCCLALLLFFFSQLLSNR